MVGDDGGAFGDSVKLLMVDDNGGIKGGIQ